MKTTILSFIFILCFTCFLKAQEYQYVPLVQEDVTWSYYSTMQVGTFEYDTIFFRYKFEGDTIINETSYKKLYYSNCSASQVYTTAMREDDKKIFLFDEWYQSEILLCDFNLKEGDTYHNDDYYTIISIDTIEIAGQKRKQFNFNDGRFFQWIEGIGTISYGRTFFEPLFQGIIPESSTSLNYQKKGDEIIYKSKEFIRENECLSNGIKGDLSKRPEIKVEAGNDLLKLFFNNPFSGQVNLLDYTGKMLYQKTLSGEINFTVDVSRFPKGMYILQIEGTNKELLNRKIIIN